MFAYPKQAEFNRPVPKNKIYGYAKPSRSIRDRFVSQVREIVWKYKLAPETVNLPGKQAIHEIQVFAVVLKTGELAEDVLRTMDKAIPSLLFIELNNEGRVKFAAACKRPNEANSRKNVVEAYFETPWQPANHPRPTLPMALDLAGLYEQMLRQHMLASPMALVGRPGVLPQMKSQESVKAGGKVRRPTGDSGRHRRLEDLRNCNALEGSVCPAAPAGITTAAAGVDH